MMTSRLMTRAVAKTRRMMASRLRRRDLRMSNSSPMISFSFDDAPTTAFDLGGRILQDHGGRATYYVSLGLAGQMSDVGPIAGVPVLARAVEAGHELGCHTYDHFDAWHTDAGSYLASVDANSRALAEALPGYRFESFAYPKSGASVGVKAGLAARFLCCRGGGQAFNSGTVDLNLLSACFLDVRAKVDIGFIRYLIDENRRQRGWLIFVTHDVSDEPSPYGTSTRFFESVVRSAADSGALLLPVSQACRKIGVFR